MSIETTEVSRGDFWALADALRPAQRPGEHPLQTARRLVAENARLREQVEQLNKDLEAHGGNLFIQLSETMRRTRRGVYRVNCDILTVQLSDAMRRIDDLEAEIKRLTAERNDAEKLLGAQRDLLEEAHIKGWLAAEGNP